VELGFSTKWKWIR